MQVNSSSGSSNGGGSGSGTQVHSNVESKEVVIKDEIVLQTSHELRGVKVQFPRQPYECQLRFMESVIVALSTKQNALLESPTGTGKTLCLLCASLAWQVDQQMKLDAAPPPTASSSTPIPSISSGGTSFGDVFKLLKGSNGRNTNSSPDAPNQQRPTAGLIIYATRTHSQLAQVVSELRNTAYRPRMSILGSREQLCVHEKLNGPFATKPLRGSMLNHACTNLTSKHACQYRTNLDSQLNGGAVLNLGTNSNLGGNSSGSGSSGVEELSGVGINSNSGTIGVGEVVDIEELVSVGRSKRICPYFYSRETATGAQLVLMPYNYLLDATIRRTLKLDWQGAIIIFDEAHNLERVASDAASFSLTATDISNCITELQTVLRVVRDEHLAKKETETTNSANATSGAAGGGGSSGNTTRGSTGRVGSAGSTDVMDNSVQRPSLSGVASLLTAMFQLEKRIDSVALGAINGLTTPAAVLPGMWLIQTFVASGLKAEKDLDELRRCVSLLVDLQQEALGTADAVMGSSGGAPPAYASEPKLAAFLTAYERIFRCARAGGADDYRVFINEEITKSPGNVGNLNGSNNIKRRVINYWCFSSGVALSELVALGVRSVILTSGTLSPMDAMRDDLRLPFNIALQNPHVIAPEQLFVGAIGAGATGKVLNSSFSQRDSDTYKDELATTLLAIYSSLISRDVFSTNPSTQKAIAIRQTTGGSSGKPLLHTTNGGVLVFFPTYAVMESAVERWKQTGAFDQLRTAMGAVVVEPRGSAGAGSAPSNGGKNNRGMTSETKRLGYDTSRTGSKGSFMLPGGNKNAQPGQDNANGGDEGFLTVVTEFERSLKRWGSCLLLAVCRGKVSEGIDFSDAKGRVVVVTGIPFAPYMDPWVVLKKQFLDDRFRTLSAPSNVQKNTVSPYESNPSPYSTLLEQTNAGKPNPWSVASTTVPPPIAAPTIPGTRGPAQSNRSKGEDIQLLTGQAWYQQSASRAVNQALGRVIRHRRDWGAVFLLDERFLQDRHVSQLSGWMRPQVRKFAAFQQSVDSFCSFLERVASDPLLTPPPGRFGCLPPAENAVAIPATLRPHYHSLRRAGTGSGGVERVVEISEELLGEGNSETSYIARELLLSQRDTSKPSASVGSNGFNKGPPEALDIDDLLSMPPAAVVPQPKRETMDLRTLIGRMRGATPAASSTSSSNNKGIASIPTQHSQVHTETRDNEVDHFHLLDVDVKLPSTTSVIGIPPVGKGLLGKSFGLSAKGNDSDDETLPTPAAIPEKKTVSSSQSASSLFAQLKGSTTSNQNNAPPVEPKLKESPDTALLAELKSSIRELKRFVDKEEIKKFQTTVTDARRKGLDSISKVRVFAADILQLLSSAPSELQLTVAKQLAVLVDRRLSDTYLDLVRSIHRQQQALKRNLPSTSNNTDVISAVGAAGSGGDVLAHLHSSIPPRPPAPQQSVLKKQRLESDLNTIENVPTSVGSRRARMMLSLSQNSTSQVGAVPTATNTGDKRSLISRLQSVSSMEVRGPVATRGVNRVIDPKAVSHARLECIVCKSIAELPCAGRCGHVCCENCWRQWLRVKSECPQCRQPASTDSITRIVVRSSAV